MLAAASPSIYQAQLNTVLGGMPRPIHEVAADVWDESSFLDFARALMNDRVNAERKEEANPATSYGPDAGGWENTTIESFLEAAISWSEDSKFGTEIQELSISHNPWRMFAYFLLAGSRYE